MIYDCLNFNEEDAKERNDDLQGEIDAVFCCLKYSQSQNTKTLIFGIGTLGNFLINSKVFQIEIINLCYTNRDPNFMHRKFLFYVRNILRIF